HPQRFEPVHPRHLQIERDHVRLQVCNFLQREGSVHGRSDDFDVRIPGQNARYQLAHERGIVHDKNSNAFAHAVASKGSARDSRASTSGTLRMSTMVPSPRIESLLTRTLEMISLVSALVTNSSSPTRLPTRSLIRLFASS